MNTDHAAAIGRMAGSEGWRMAAVDVDGCDLVREESVRRIAWAAPVADAGGVRDQLMRLSRKDGASPQAPPKDSRPLET